MSTPNDTRPIWLTHADLMDECDNLRSICRAQFAAAPADPLRVAAGALLSTHNEAPDDADRADAYVDASAVLEALGYPRGARNEPYCSGHEFVSAGACHGMEYRECKHCGFPEHKLGVASREADS